MAKRSIRKFSAAFERLNQARYQAYCTC